MQDTGITATFWKTSQLDRFIADTRPAEVLADPYAINRAVPYPCFPDSLSDPLDIVRYTPYAYKITLNERLFTLDSVLSSVAVKVKNASPQKTFWHVAQLNGIYNRTDKHYSLRPLTASEIQATIGTGLAFGAKGIMGWVYRTYFDANYVYTGVVDTNYNHSSNFLTVDGISVFGGFNEVWKGYKQTMKQVDTLSSVLSALSWQGLKRWFYTPDNSSYGTWNGLVSGITTKNISGVEDSLYQKYVVTGHFTYGGNDYILVVNRRCDDADTRNITVTLNASGYKEIQKVTTNKKWIVNTNGSFTDTFAPGEFNLYKISSMVYTWSGDITVMNTVTVSSGTTLTINPGTTVRFRESYYDTEEEITYSFGLTSNGKLLANGTTAQPILFTSLSGAYPGSWGSIILNGSGAHASKISNAVIKYATELRVTNVTTPYYYFIVDSVTFDTTVNAVNSYGSNGWVMNSKINYPQDHGILANEGSTIACYHNKIKKTNHNGAGIIFGGGSSDLVWHNDITGFEWGAGAIWGSSPTFGHSNNTGTNNRITNCYYGLKIYEDSYPGIGYYDDYTTYGNSIFNNSPYNAYLYNCTEGGIYAFDVYWADTSKFYKSNVAGFSFIPFLTSNPWSGIPLLKSGGQNNQIMSSTENKLRTGIILRKSGKFVEAKDHFISMIRENPGSPSTYVELYNTYNDTTGNDILNTFTSLQSEAPPIAKLLRANLHLREGEIDKAKEVNNVLIAENPGKTISVKAMLNNFYISLYDENVKDEAKKILDEVISKSELTTELELSLAQHALKTFVPVELEDRQQLRKQGTNKAVSVPTQFELFQNYPNPFNPTTTITYSLPEPNDVILKLYDYLGREVATVLNSYKTAGVHTVTVDATQLSSGVYFYRIKAGVNTAINKMVVMK